MQGIRLDYKSILLFALFIGCPGCQYIDDSYGYLNAKEPFRQLLIENNALREIGGSASKILGNNKLIIVSVGVAQIDGKLTVEAIKRAREEAQYNYLKYVNEGSVLLEEKTTKEQTTITNSKGNEGSELEKKSSLFKYSLKGKFKDSEVLANWKDKDKKLLFVLVGSVCEIDSKNNR